MIFAALFAGLAWGVSVSAAALGWLALTGVLLCLRHPLPALLLLVAAMLLSPEARLADGVVIRFGDLIVPCLLVGLIVRQTCNGRGELVWRRAAPDGFLLALLGVQAVSSVLGVSDGRVEMGPAILWNFKILELISIYWLTFNLLRTPRQVRLLLGMAGLVYVAVMVYALAAIPGTEVYSAHRLSAPFEGTPEPTTLGGYLTLASGIVIAIALYEPSPRRKALWWMLAALCVIPVLYTFSRTTYLSYVFVLLCLGLLARRPGLMAVVSLLLLLLFLWGPGPVLDRLASTFDDSRAHGLDPSVWERIDVWNKVRYNLNVYPFFGRGFPQPILDSQFARILIESGSFGMLAWIGVLGGCARIGARLFRHTSDPLHKGIALGYLAVLAGLLVHSAAAITFYIVRIMEPFWLLTGIVAFLDHHERRHPAPVQAALNPKETNPRCAESAA